MSSSLIKIRIRETESKLAKERAKGILAMEKVDNIFKLEEDLDEWKEILFQVEAQEFEDRVGFKSMERNAGVWDER